MNATNAYLFIDGGHLRKYYTESVRKWFNCEGEIDFTKLKQSFNAQKMFYYDCLDDIKHSSESQAAFEARIEQQELYFNKIREIVGSHVRLGSLTGTAKNKRQKEVDILLAVDMMNHAVRKNMDKAILLSGDRDFKPVVESLVQMGLVVEVAGDKFHTSKDLAWAADSYRELSFGSYYGWSIDELPKKFPIGIATINQPPQGGSIIEQGILNGETVILYKWSGTNNYYIDIPRGKNNNRLTLQYNKLEPLKLYFELQYGKVDWKPPRA